MMPFLAYIILISVVTCAYYYSIIITTVIRIRLLVNAILYLTEFYLGLFYDCQNCSIRRHFYYHFQRPKNEFE
jgi:hypothetical protein